MARIDREQLGELLSGYIDGELNPREREVIERVLREDESARQLLADLQRTARAVSSLPRHAAPASILGDTQAALERSALLHDFPDPRAHQTRGRTSWAVRWAMAAMVGLVVVTGWWFTSEQSRRGSTGKTELARREVRETAPIPAPTTIAISDADRSAGAAVATVEQQLAAGVDPTSFRSQTFAAEPVRLQVTVRDRAEREAVATRIAAALSTQRLADLAVTPTAGVEESKSAQNFYYRGRAGVNFEADDEDQILVRASPQQIDQILTGLSEPDRPPEAVVLVVGPITVRGVEKSRSVVQLLGDEQQAAASQSLREGDGGLVGGLLKIVGIDPKLLTTEVESAAGPSVPPAEFAVEAPPTDARQVDADDTSVAVADAKESAGTEKAAARKKAVASAVGHAPGQPPPPPPLVERRLRAAAESQYQPVGEADRRRGGEEPPGSILTVVVQIIEQPKPVETDKPMKAKPDRSPTSKGIK